jgi:hypothetical protein
LRRAGVLVLVLVLVLGVALAEPGLAAPMSSAAAGAAGCAVPAAAPVPHAVAARPVSSSAASRQFLRITPDRSRGRPSAQADPRRRPGQPGRAAERSAGMI